MCNTIFAKLKTVFLFLGLYILALVIMHYLTAPLTFKDIFLAQISYSKLKLFYNQLVVSGLLQKYINGLWWDFVYILTYSGLLFSVLVYLKCRLKLKVNLMSLQNPVIIIALTDIFENILELLTLPKVNSITWIRLSFSWIKWLFVFITIVIIFELMFKVFFKRIKRDNA